jgi:hypothetical protein
VLYDKSWSIPRTEWGTSIELALDRHYAGIVVNVGELNDGKSHTDIEQWTKNVWAPRAFGKKWGPDLILNATPLPLLDDAPADVPRVANQDRRFMQIHFLTHDPKERWKKGYAQYGTELEASGLAKHLWTAPFIPTVFGTDTYTEQLW